MRRRRVSTDAGRAVEAVWRVEAARLIAGLARLVHDVGLAEELAQDALVAALEQWPREGVPPNPGGWLMSVAKHRAIDQLRRVRNEPLELLDEHLFPYKSTNRSKHTNWPRWHHSCF